MLLRLILASIPFFAGLIAAIVLLFKGQLASALTSVVCGIIVSSVCWFGFRSLSTETYATTVFLAMMIGIGGVFLTGNLFNFQLQQGYAEVLPRFLNMEMFCPHAVREVQRVQNYGIKACGLQHNIDALGATSDLYKEVQFGPAISLADSVLSATEDKEVNHCARAFKEADRVCPLAFSSMDKGVREALLDAAK